MARVAATQLESNAGYDFQPSALPGKKSGLDFPSASLPHNFYRGPRPGHMPVLLDDEQIWAWRVEGASLR